MILSIENLIYGNKLFLVEVILTKIDIPRTGPSKEVTLMHKFWILTIYPKQRTINN